MLKLFNCFQNKKYNNKKYNYNNMDNQKDNDVSTINMELNNINEKDSPYFTFSGKTFIAKPCHIYDGDTFSIIFRYNNEYIKYKCRCIGYDSPEMKPLKSNPNRDVEKALAIKSRDRFIELLNKHHTKLIKVECLEFDKYGRLLINAWNMIDSKSINEIMIEEGYGKKYDGGTKEKWTNN